MLLPVLSPRNEVRQTTGSGLMFIAVNLLLSRVSRRLEIRERKRTAIKAPRVMGVEDQVAAETDLATR